MPTTAIARPRLRVIHPPDRDDPRPPARRALDWHRYGRLPNGAAPGCYLDLVVHEGRPPAGLDSRWYGELGRWVSIRLVDPLDVAG